MMWASEPVQRNACETAPHCGWPRRARAALGGAALLVLGALSGCAVVTVAGAIGGAAISVAGAVVSTGITVGGKVIGASVDALTPDDAPAMATAP
jgi:hypothetical protein